jgi:hypothetical protein
MCRSAVSGTRGRSRHPGIARWARFASSLSILRPPCADDSQDTRGRGATDGPLSDARPSDDSQDGSGQGRIDQAAAVAQAAGVRRIHRRKGSSARRPLRDCEEEVRRARRSQREAASARGGRHQFTTRSIRLRTSAVARLTCAAWLPGQAPACARPRTWRLVVRVRGDGREYQLNLYVSGRMKVFSCRAPVQTRSGECDAVMQPWYDLASCAPRSPWTSA